MPIKELSPTTKSILTLLNNAHELITISSRRKDAKDVIHALKAYAKTKNYALPDDKINNLLLNLLDCRSNTLSYLITDIAQTIVKQQ